MGGESLVNDGSGLVAYRLAVAAVVTEALSAWEAGLDFLLVCGGGIIPGLILAWAVLPLWKRVRDPSIFIALSVLTPYAVYMLAEECLDGVRYALCDATGWHRDYSPPAWRNRATEEQKRIGWEMAVHIEKIIATVLDEAYKRQVEEVMDKLEEGPEGLYKRPPY